jgi:hypothetical protein
VTLKWSATPADSSGMTNPSSPAKGDHKRDFWIGLAVIAAVVAIVAVLVANGATDFCANHPNGPGCLDGHAIRDSADDAVKDRREADAEANQKALTEVCAAMREAGQTDACTD